MKTTIQNLIANGKRSESNTSESVYISFEFDGQTHEIRFSKHECGYSRESVEVNGGYKHGNLFAFSYFFGKVTEVSAVRTQQSNQPMSGAFKVEEILTKKGKINYINYFHVTNRVLTPLLTTEEVSEIIDSVNLSSKFDGFRVY